MVTRLLTVLLMVAVQHGCALNPPVQGELRIALNDEGGAPVGVILVEGGRAALVRTGSDATIWFVGAYANEHEFVLPLSPTMVVTFNPDMCDRHLNWSLAELGSSIAGARCAHESETSQFSALSHYSAEENRFVVLHRSDGSRVPYTPVFDRRGGFLGIWFGPTSELPSGTFWRVVGRPPTYAEMLRAIGGSEKN